MIATEPEQKRPGLQVGELPFMDPRGSVLSLTGPLAIGDPRVICRPLARLCEKAAKLQRLDLDKLKYDGIYALLGISEDGSVMALSWRDDAWLPTGRRSPHRWPAQKNSAWSSWARRFLCSLFGPA